MPTSNRVLIARPGQFLCEHLEAVGSRCSEFCQILGLPQTGLLLGIAHDEGKASSKFQGYIKSIAGYYDVDDEHYVDAHNQKGKIDHSTAAAQKLWRTASEETSNKIPRLYAQILAISLFSHHSGLPDCLTPDGKDGFQKRINKPERDTHLPEVIRTFGWGFERPEGSLLRHALEELERHCTPRLVKPRGEACEACGGCAMGDPLGWFSLGLTTRMLLSCLLDADRIDSADAGNPTNRALRGSAKQDWSSLVKRLEEHLAQLPRKRPIDEVRARISNHCLVRSRDDRGVFKLTVPTGGGKTLASLRFAMAHAAHHGMTRVINVIPYTSIIDQNARVARDILENGSEPGSVVLEHHSNLAPDDETPRARLLSENWDAPVVYTTMVQFLDSIFKSGTRAARRMHRLAEAVLVFDEIQTLPVNCVALFVNAVNFLVRECGSTVVLCTATQPLLDRRTSSPTLELAPASELVHDVEALFDSLKRVEIVDLTRPRCWSPRDVAELALKERDRAGSCLVVVNTKEWAKQVYEECAAAGNGHIFHLSTSMCPAHRMRVLDKVQALLDAKLSVVCVSTQLIEAGVDISFGAVVRLLAGMDSIVQAAGRCNRHGEVPMGIVSVVNGAGEKLDQLPTIRKGQECAWEVLIDFRDDPESLGGTLTHPLVIERYFRYSFFEHKAEMHYNVSDKNSGLHSTLFNLLSCNKGNPGNLTDKSLRQAGLRQSFATAGTYFTVIDSPTEGVIVPYGEGQEIIANLCSVSHPAEQTGLLRRAQRYSVNLFPAVFKALRDIPAVHQTQEGSGIWHLDPQYYSKQFGVSTSPVSDWESYPSTI